ncbi:MAG: hypothetical protein QXL17_03165 [Candidatus Thermoplasmatota archaeon]
MILKKLQTTDAVSETLGTLLMISFAVSVFSVLTLVIVNPWANMQGPERRFVNIVGAVEDDKIVLLHKGGEALSPSVEIVYTIRYPGSAENPDGSEVVTKKTVGETFSMQWSIGQSITYQGQPELPDAYVHVKIVDRENNLVILDKVLQESPYVVMNPVVENTITEDVDGTWRATVSLFYDFINYDFFSSYTGEDALSFTYTVATTEYTKYVLKNGIKNTISTELSSLPRGTQISVSAHLKYINSLGTTITKHSTTVIFWTYTTPRADYQFTTEETLLHDGMEPKVHGSSFQAPYDVSYQQEDGYDAVFFDEDVDDRVVIPYHHKFDVTDSFKVNFRAKFEEASSNDFFGKIQRIDQKLFGGSFFNNVCYSPDMIPVYGSTNDVVIVCTDGTTSNLYIFTVQVNTDGSIGGIRDTKTITKNIYYLNPCIYYISNDMYIVIAAGSSDFATPQWAYLRLLINPTTGSISLIDTKQVVLGPYYGWKPTMIHIERDIYAVCFGGHYNPVKPIETGGIITLTISPSGVTQIDTRKLPYPYCTEVDIIHVTDNYYAVIYGGDSTVPIRQLNINIFYINPYTGKIGLYSVANASFQYDQLGFKPDIIAINSTSGIFAICYSQAWAQMDRYSFVQTIYISQERGAFSINTIDSYICPFYAQDMKIISMRNDLYTLAYVVLPSYTSTVSTIKINQNGYIQPCLLDRYTYTDPGCFVKLIPMSSDTAIMCFGGLFSTVKGFLSTIRVSCDIRYQVIIEKNAVFAVKANGPFLIAEICTMGGVKYELVADKPSGWVEISLEYMNNQMRFQVGSNIFTKQGHGTMVVVPVDIFMGPFYGYIDYLKIGKNNY